MRHVNYLIAILGFVTVSASHAAEITYDITTCHQGTVTMLSKTKELTIFAVESNGISFSNDNNKTFDGNTAHCLGTVKINEQGSVRQGYCKYLRTDGEFVVGEWKQVDKQMGTWTYLQGTGSLAGIKGGGTYQRVVQGKPIHPGTYNNCGRATGKYTLP